MDKSLLFFAYGIAIYCASWRLWDEWKAWRLLCKDADSSPRRQKV